MVNTVNATIVKDTFNKEYNEDDFKIFISELLPNANLSSEIEHRIQLPQTYNDFIRSAKRIAKYNYISQEYNEEKVLDVLVVKLKKTTSIDRARTAQRNFIARYLNGSRSYQKDAALVAFISEDENGNISPDWRFSLIQMNYVTEIIEDANGKKKRKTSVELTPAKRFSFLVGANEDTHTAQKQFFTCLEKSSKGEPITIEDLVLAFDIEKVSKEFFDKYKNLYQKLVTELQKLKDTDKEVFEDFNKHNINLDDFAKKTLGQLVFLYFIQKKGWLGVKKDENWGQGDKKFLRNLFNKKYCEYNNFFNDVLEHLFYEALATDRGVGAWFDKLNCRIPFLNGGLFEPVNGYEYERTNLTIDNNLFKEIFDTFDLYNFTVKEDEPLEKEVAIDPEMLGKVFENLLPENIRKGNGAFYTPREIVHYMCQESLINYLYNKINIKEVPLTIEEKEKQLKLLKTKKEKEQLKLTQEVLEEIISKDDINYLIKKGDSIYSNKDVNAELPESIKKNAKIIDDALNHIKVCDPAIGSGAFPVGMMNEIVRARAALNDVLNIPDRPAYALKRNAIENSIYGVDIDPGAVEIAKLRFWLSLVVDEEDIKNIRPLPNLDYKIMQGNSLITSYEGIDFDEIVVNQLIDKQLGLFTLKSGKITEKITEKQNEFLKTPYATKKGEIKQEIEDLIVELVKTKFEEKAEIEGKSKKFYEEKIRNFAQNKENRNFFPWRLFFADAFEEGGFDVVIGNPPYGVSIKGDYRKSVEIELGKVPDYEIYYYFIELSNNLLKNRATLSYIIPNTWLFNTFAEKYRIKLLNTWSIKEILDCSKFEIFESATVRNTINLFQKGISNEVGYRKTTNILCFADLIKNPLLKISTKSILGMNQNWSLAFLLDEKIIKIISKIKETSNNLINYFPEISQGLIAYDKYRGQSTEIIKNRAFHYTSKIKENLKKWLWGADVKRYIVTWNRQEYIDYCEGIANPRDPKFFVGKRILIREITNPSIYAALTSEELYNDPSILIIKDNNNMAEILLGILNSKLATFYHFNNSPKAVKGAFPKILVKDIKEFPLPNISSEFANNIKIIVLKLLSCLEATENNELQKIQDYENQIDILVYKLYDLTYDEVLVIDKDFSLSEEEYNNYRV